MRGQMRISTTSCGASGPGTDRRLTPRASCTTSCWVATKMGGAGAPDDMDQAHLTQAWLAASDDPAARTTGGYFYHLKPREPNPEAQVVALQDRLIDICREISGLALPPR